MAVLVTGGSGFLGRFILEKFDDAVVLDLHPPKNGIFEFGSVTSWPDIVRVFRNHEIEGVIHAAAELSIKAEKSYLDAFRVNTEGTLNILEACRLFDVRKVVFTSSHSVYGVRSQFPLTEHSFRDPSTFYGVTKACSEIIGGYFFYNHGIDFRIARFPVIVGPFRRGMGASVSFSSFIDDAFFGRKAVIRLPLETQLPVLYVRDAAELIYKLYSKKTVSRQIFNVGGVPVELREMVDAARKLLSFEPEINYGDTEKEISQKWTRMTEIAMSSGILELKIDELGWEAKWNSPEKMVEDHIRTLEMEVEH